MKIDRTTNSNKQYNLIKIENAKLSNILKDGSVAKVQLIRCFQNDFVKSPFINSSCIDYKFLDNVLVARNLLLRVILMNDLSTRIMVMRLRLSLSKNTKTYVSEANIVLLTNCYFLRFVEKSRPIDAGYHTQSNLYQYNLVRLSAPAICMIELSPAYLACLRINQ